jgi:hypothetical protein
MISEDNTLTIVEKPLLAVSIACCVCNKKHSSVGLGHCSLMTVHDIVVYTVKDAVKSVRDLLSAGVCYVSFGI